MKAWASLLSVLMMCATCHLGSVSAEVSDPGAPQYANNVLGGFVTPTIRPGESLIFGFNLSNPYDDLQGDMWDSVLTVGIYKYATQEESETVDSGFPNPPVFNNMLPEKDIYFGVIEIGETVRVNLTIDTDKDTPHGSYFSQSTYFVRFRLEFHFPGNSTLVVLQSRGFFTEEQWDQMVSFDPEESIVNITYMHSLGVDGLIPDSSFGIKIPIPRWPLGVLIGAICFTGSLALYYYVMDNPGEYPKLEKRFYELRGKLSQLRGKLHHRRRK